MKNIVLFDMDGVLLRSRGYQRSLQDSVQRIANSLGAPNTHVHEDQIAKFEALGVTNEWDSLAICTALILMHVWQIKPDIRLKSILPHAEILTTEPANFDWFLSHYSHTNDLPGLAAYKMIVSENAWLTDEQQAHLFDVLKNCRDMYKSPTLPAHQESVLGSKLFQETYALPAQLDVESNLLKFDHPIINSSFRHDFLAWLENENDRAAIMTNRPNRSPDGYLSAPEAEIGVNILGLDFLPFLGTGMLSWFASTQLKTPEISLIKPNPVHALALIQMCLGESVINALRFSTHLWSGKWDKTHWESLKNSTIVVFEDSVKGLQSAKHAHNLLSDLGIDVNLKLVGVESHPIKTQALMLVTDIIIDNINRVKWKGNQFLDELFN